MVWSQYVYEATAYNDVVVVVMTMNTTMTLLLILKTGKSNIQMNYDICGI